MCRKKKAEHFKELKAKKHSNKNINKDLEFFTFEDFEFVVISEIKNIPILWLRGIEEIYISYLYTSFELYNINHFTTSFNQPVCVGRNNRIAYRKITKIEKNKLAKMINEKAAQDLNR